PYGRRGSPGRRKGRPFRQRSTGTYGWGRRRRPIISTNSYHLTGAAGGNSAPARWGTWAVISSDRLSSFYSLDIRRRSPPAPARYTTVSSKKASIRKADRYQ